MLGERAERADLFDQRVDLGIAIERLMAPRRVEIAPLQKLPRRGADDRARTFAVEALAPAQQAAQALARRAERLLEPAIESAFEEFAGDVVGCDLEHRIDARLDRPLAQQIGAERMNRADARLLELAERAGEPRALAGISCGSLRALSISPRSRSFSSPAAFSVKVTATIRSSSARPPASAATIRLTSAVVLPVPAAASTISVVSRSLRIRSRTR